MTDKKQDRLEKQISFCKEIDRQKQIVRRNYLTDGQRLENDAEHAWHMAVMALVLSEYANEEIDVFHTVSMLLIHDLVEIYAGDTYAYDEEAGKTQQEREQAAAQKIFGLLPKDQAARFRALWEEFEKEETEEAKFARTMDNFQPALLNSSSDGKSWSENGVRLSQVLNRNRNTAKGSKQLWEYSLENFITPHVQKGNIRED